MSVDNLVRTAGTLGVDVVWVEGLHRPCWSSRSLTVYLNPESPDDIVRWCLTRTISEVQSNLGGNSHPIFY